VECALNGAKHIVVVNRNAEKGQELASLLNKNTDAKAEFIFWDKEVKIPEKTEILINATSVGFSPDVNSRPDIDYNTVLEDMCVCDVVFNPAETLFLKAAEEKGAKTVNGLGMLVQQAALNFTLWTDEEAPVEIMREALKREFTN